jgi:hypothetical protein
VRDFSISLYKEERGEEKEDKEKRILPQIKCGERSLRKNKRRTGL